MSVEEFILRNPRGECSPANILISVLWNLKQRTSWMRHTIPTPGLQKHEIINGCCFDLPNMWQFVWQQQKTNIPSFLTVKCCSLVLTIPVSYHPLYYERVQFYKSIFHHQPLSTVSSHSWGFSDSGAPFTIAFPYSIIDKDCLIQ